MNAKTEMIEARETLAVALDAKLGNTPEWKAIRAIDRALLALERESSGSPLRHHIIPAHQANPIGVVVHAARAVPSYAEIVFRALVENNSPLTTPEVMEIIARHRTIEDPEKAKVNVTSSLSKDARISSVPWQGGRAWWFSDREPPKKETPDLLE